MGGEIDIVNDKQRLRPYTVVSPKSLMPIGEYSILEIIDRQFVFFGFGHITLVVNHQAEIIQALRRSNEQKRRSKGCIRSRKS